MFKKYRTVADCKYSNSWLHGFCRRRNKFLFLRRVRHNLNQQSKNFMRRYYEKGNVGYTLFKSIKRPKNEAYAKHNRSLRFWKSILKLLNLAKEREKEKRMNKIQLTKVFVWKYSTCFKPFHMFLASELIKNLYAATYATMLMKSSGLLHEAVRCPFSVCKHILSIFWGWIRLFSKHTEAEHKIHHSYKKKLYLPWATLPIWTRQPCLLF